MTLKRDYIVILSDDEEPTRPVKVPRRSHSDSGSHWSAGEETEGKGSDETKRSTEAGFPIRRRFQAGPKRSSASPQQIEGTGQLPGSIASQSEINNPVGPVFPTTATTTVPSQTTKAHIYAHTTLHIHHPTSSTTYVPVKLRSCLTIPNLFANAAKAWDIEVDAIAALRVRAETGGAGASMRIKKDMPDTFECFLEMVEGMWVGECRMRVDIEVKA
ncbi:MAG: hypothetical protein LQ352_008215 [Teloschistes flavicans]|nr:MAG: hypothetical protein LQ352_008215 [Teloschistes flavicans]